MTGPDFLIIGAMKSGTTSLQAQLAAQTGIFMTTPKEPNFFSDDNVYARGADWYESLFLDAAPGDLKGEASTHYTKLPTYPETITRLAAMVPTPRLIYVIRNPMIRAVSHYIHEWSRSTMNGDVQDAFVHNDEMVAYGCYGMQIAPFVDRFGPEAVMLTSLEQLQSDPDEELVRIGQHIGAPYPLVWDQDMMAQNVSAGRVRKIPFQKLLIDNPVAEILRRTLVPKSVRAQLRASRSMTDRPTLPEGLQQELKQRFAEDRKVLAQLFPDHPAIDLCYPFCAP